MSDHIYHCKVPSNSPITERVQGNGQYSNRRSYANVVKFGVDDHDYFYKTDLEYAENEIYEPEINIFENDHSYSHCSPTDPIIIENKTERSGASDFQHQCHHAHSLNDSDHCTLSYADVVKQQIQPKSIVTTHCSPNLITDTVDSEKQSSVSQITITSNNSQKRQKNSNNQFYTSTTKSCNPNTRPVNMDCTTSNSLSSVHVPITEKVSLDVKSSSPLVTRKNSKQHAIIQLQNSVPPSSSKISIDRTIYNVFFCS